VQAVLTKSIRTHTVIIPNKSIMKLGVQVHLRMVDLTMKMGPKIIRMHLKTKLWEGLVERWVLTMKIIF